MSLVSVSSSGEPARELRPSALSDQRPVTTVRVWSLLRAHWRLLSMLAIAGLIVGALPGLLKGRPFTSESSFASQARSATAVSALAAQFGVQAGGDPSQSPLFYAELLTSRAILEPLLVTHPAGLRPGVLTLEQQMASGEDDPGKRHVKSLDRLRSAIRANVNSATGVVTVRVTTESPRLSQAIGASLINAVNAFNLRRRQERAAADKEFAEQRLAEAGADVHAAEDRLAVFLEENRSRIAPRLGLDEERLRREISTRQELYTSLIQDYQRAKLDEARNDPAITVIDPPELPMVGDSRGTVTGALLGLLAGFGLAAVYVYARAFVTILQRRSDAAATI